jgi:hypothetical protein
LEVRGERAESIWELQRGFARECGITVRSHDFRAGWLTTRHAVLGWEQFRRMTYREPHPSAVTRAPSICLDYGVDETSDGVDFAVSERGMRFSSRWQFSIGTQLSVVCAWRDPRLGLRRMTIDGIVVWCGPGKQTGYETTLLFLELPDELKSSLREFSHCLDR